MQDVRWARRLGYSKAVMYILLLLQLLPFYRLRIVSNDSLWQKVQFKRQYIVNLISPLHHFPLQELRICVNAKEKPL